MLLVGAALLGASFANLRRQEPGFDPARALTAGVSLPASRYPDASAQPPLPPRLPPAVRRPAACSGGCRSAGARRGLATLRDAFDRSFGPRLRTVSAAFRTFVRA